MLQPGGVVTFKKLLSMRKTAKTCRVWKDNLLSSMAVWSTASVDSNDAVVAASGFQGLPHCRSFFGVAEHYAVHEQVVSCAAKNMFYKPMMSCRGFAGCNVGSS